MRRDFNLENGIYCKGLFSDFKLYYDTIELTPSCNNISYIPNKLIVVKSKKMIYVYKPKIIIVCENPTLFEIARFESKTPDAYLKVKINDKTYIIDPNLQITLCKCQKLT